MMHFSIVMLECLNFREVHYLECKTEVCLLHLVFNASCLTSTLDAGDSMQACFYLDFHYYSRGGEARSKLACLCLYYVSKAQLFVFLEGWNYTGMSSFMLPWMNILTAVKMAFLAWSSPIHMEEQGLLGEEPLFGNWLWFELYAVPVAPGRQIFYPFVLDMVYANVVLTLLFSLSALLLKILGGDVVLRALIIHALSGYWRKES
ncbi:hypothetical protein Ancab_006129 [Ancistrocladus abbreviatus]